MIVGLTFSHIVFIDLFQLAELKNLCKEPLSSIHNWKECKTAQLWLQKSNPMFTSSRFVNASGDGTSLPLGCISDRVSDNHNIYWNPEGTAISADTKLRLICKNNPLVNSGKIAYQGLNLHYRDIWPISSLYSIFISFIFNR